MSKWKSMKDAPRDGTKIKVSLFARSNWDELIVWYSGEKYGYPWEAGHTAYPEGAISGWRPIT